MRRNNTTIPMTYHFAKYLGQTHMTRYTTRAKAQEAERKLALGLIKFQPVKLFGDDTNVK